MVGRGRAGVGGWYDFLAQRQISGDQQQCSEAAHGPPAGVSAASECCVYWSCCWMLSQPPCLPVTQPLDASVLSPLLDSSVAIGQTVTRLLPVAQKHRSVLYYTFSACLSPFPRTPKRTGTTVHPQIPNSHSKRSENHYRNELLGEQEWRVPLQATASLPCPPPVAYHGGWCQQRLPVQQDARGRHLLQPLAAGVSAALLIFAVVVVAVV